jgi:Co/Zn/Cd efflux system component
MPPAALPLAVTGRGALTFRLTCAFILARHQNQGGSLTRAAFLSARNNVLANIAMIAAGLVTASTRSAEPHLILLWASASR